MQRLNRFALAAFLLVGGATGGCSRRPADDVIATQIKARFFSDPAVKLANLTVAVNKGLVTLSGAVPSADVQLQAFKLAAYTDGVVRIDDRMVLASPQPVAVRATPAAVPVEVRHEQKIVTALAAPETEPVRQSETPVQVTPEPRPPGGPRTPENVRIGGVRAPLLARIQPAPAPPLEPEVIYDPGIAVIAVTPERSRRPGGLLVAGPPAAGALFDRWFSDFNHFSPEAQFSYRGTEAIDGRAELNVTDVPPAQDQIAISRRTTLQFPAAIEAVVLISNLAGAGQELNFSADVLAGIFSARITRWNDPAIAALNPQTTLPAADIWPVHRADTSGTTAVLTDYLSKASPGWRLGSGPAISWPGGVNGQGDEGVAALVRQTPYSIGYVTLAFAVQNRLPFGTVRNAAGRNVKATPGSLTAAAASMPASSIVNAPGPAAYPISGFTWLVTPDRFRDKARRDNVTNFLNWMLTQGQRYPSQFGYAPLPQEIASRAIFQIARIR